MHSDTGKRGDPFLSVRFLVRFSLILGVAQAAPPQRHMADPLLEEHSEMDLINLAKNTFQDYVQMAEDGVLDIDSIPDFIHWKDVLSAPVLDEENFPVDTTDYLNGIPKSSSRVRRALTADERKIEYEWSEELGGWFKVKKNFEAHAGKDGVGFEAGAEASALAGLARAEGGGGAEIDRYGFRAGGNAKLHLGLVGYEGEVDIESSLFRQALKASLTPQLGHPDFNVEWLPDMVKILEALGAQEALQNSPLLSALISPTKLGYDVGWNRKTRSGGAVFDTPEGSFGAILGCENEVCIFNCANFKLPLKICVDKK